MSVLALPVWREWREHRFALASLAIALPIGTWLLSSTLSRGIVGNPLFLLTVALGFAVVLMVTVSGELLGAERRGAGLRWLERLPSGLATAFHAKLAFFFASLAGTTAFGYGTARSVAALRHLGGQAATTLDVILLVASTLVLGLWTFSSSAWAVRGGLAVVVTASMLAAIGYPVWRVIDAGYGPTEAAELGLFAVLTLGALIGGWLAFVYGARLGRGTLVSAALGLAPALFALALTSSWSGVRMAERNAFDPVGGTLRMFPSMISRDGRFVFVVGKSDLPRWDVNRLPSFALRVDLEHGTFEQLGTLVSSGRRYHVNDRGLYELDDLVVEVEEHAPLVFGAERGETRPFEPRSVGRPSSLGLGLLMPGDRDQPSVIRDPFRGRDYLASRFEVVAPHGHILVRPGRWLLRQSERWSWLDPDTGECTSTGWPAPSRVLVILTDGRILLANAERGLQVLEPEHDRCTTLDTQGVAAEHIYENWDGTPIPTEAHGDDGSGTILLKTSEQAWLVIDENATTVRRVSVPDSVMVCWVGKDSAIVQDWTEQRLARLDLVTGERVTLFPIRPASGSEASKQ